MLSILISGSLVSMADSLMTFSPSSFHRSSDRGCPGLSQLEKVLSAGRCLLKWRKTLGCGAIAVNSVLILVDLLDTLRVGNEAGEKA